MGPRKVRITAKTYEKTKKKANPIKAEANSNK